MNHNSTMNAETLNNLKNYFESRNDIGFAFLFGSVAHGREGMDSDVDVAVYFLPAGGDPDQEATVWADVEKIVSRETDLVVLNRAAPLIAFGSIRTGLPLAIRDQDGYLEFYRRTSSAAWDFSEFIDDYYRIAQRSQSLSPLDRNRLQRFICFMETEISEFAIHKNLTYDTYAADKAQRRNVERWVETLVMALIDTAKIILSSSKQPMPETYQLCLLHFGICLGLPETESQQLAVYVQLLNILAHEYLDIRYNRIRGFVDSAEPLYRTVIDKVKAMVA